MKAALISLSIASLVVAALFQELGGRLLYASTTGAMQVKVSASTAPNKEPLPQGLAQRLPAVETNSPSVAPVPPGPVVFDLNTSGTNRSVVFTERAPETYTSEILKVQASKSRTKRGPLYPEGAKVRGEGDVVLFLSDGPAETNDVQKILVRLPSGQTVLVVHDVLRAPAVENLRLGDRIAFSGTYTYGLNGDEINRTSRDGEDADSGGWVKHNGKVYH